MSAFSWTEHVTAPREQPPPVVKLPRPSAHPHARRIRSHHRALQVRDLQKAFKDFSDSFRLDLPPQLPFDPGEVRGPIVMVGLYRKLDELTGGQLRDELLGVTATADLAVALNRLTMTRRGRTRVIDAAWTYRFVNEKIVEAWLHVGLSASDLREVFT